MNLDLVNVKSQADLLEICRHDTPLKKVASTNGGEWAGPCPFCGGEDRFRVQPHANPYPLWMCRQCGAGKWDTVVGYLARRDRLDPSKKSELEEICRSAVGDLPIRNGRRPEPPVIPAYAPPDQEWQAAAQQVISECEATLWQPRYASALGYLKGRGLTEETIKRFRLGYCATGKAELYGREIAGMYIHRGIVIPCLIAGRIWYLKTRLLPGVPYLCHACKAILSNPGACPKCGAQNKYLGVKGNRPAVIFNADALQQARMALFCEGEFDCMIANQAFGDMMPTVTFGAATNTPDLATFGHYLLPLQAILACYDSDEAGEKGVENLVDLAGYRVKLALLPEKWKDLTDFYLGGGDLVEWILIHQHFYSDPFFLEMLQRK